MRTDKRPSIDNAKRWGPGVVIGEDVEIGEHTIVHPGTRIGHGTKIGAFCELGLPTHLANAKGLDIGPNSTIRSHSVFYEGSRFGPNLRTGHRVTVRENTVAGESLQIGTLSDIQGHCTIGNHVRLHSNVHIGQGAKVGNFVFLFPYVVLTNDATPPSNELAGVTIEDFAVVATMTTILPGVTVGTDTLVGAQTLVKENVPAGMICVGVPGKIIGSTDKIKLKTDGGPAYPWRRHFHRGYPAEVVSAWQREFE